MKPHYCISCETLVGNENWEKHLDHHVVVAQDIKENSVKMGDGKEND